MALRQVGWASRNRLQCSGCENAPIILCITPGLVDPDPCSQFDYLDATIVSVTCSAGIHTYLVEYDDADLLDPVTLLTEGDILGAFCKDCHTDWVEALIACAIEAIPPPPGGGPQGIYSELIYGNGADGDRTVVGDETLGALGTGAANNRAYFYNDLTIDPGAILRMVADYDGFDDTQFVQLFVNGTLTIDGSILSDGENGQDAAAGVGGLAGANPHLDGPGGGGCQGAAGGAGNGGAAFPLSSNASERAPGAGWAAGGFGGVGGDGGDGGGAGTPTVIGSAFESFYQVDRWMQNLTDWSSGGSFIQNAIGGGTGGGGGGGGAGANGGGGGGGGAAGATIYIAARNIIVNASGIISANGGAGGNGADGSGAPGAGGGAGAGGGGGLVYLVTQSLVNNGTIQALAGAAGAPGTGFAGSGDGLAAGAAGAGKVVVLDSILGTITVS